MSKTLVGHVVVSVADIKKSRNFYDKVLTFLGFKPMFSSRSDAGYGNGRMTFWLHQAPKKLVKEKLKRGRPGYDHIAFGAISRAQVNAMQRLLRKERFSILYPAAVHPEFTPDYYSVSFKDPDGAIIELVHPATL
jgi:catechol 2,3-dioxygenase-like lactoylglutathione lyase family enzyme